jgi:hypothetical protein
MLTDTPPEKEMQQDEVDLQKQHEVELKNQEEQKQEQKQVEYVIDDNFDDFGSFEDNNQKNMYSYFLKIDISGNVGLDRKLKNFVFNDENEKKIKNIYVNGLTLNVLHICDNIPIPPNYIQCIQDMLRLHKKYTQPKINILLVSFLKAIKYNEKQTIAKMKLASINKTLERKEEQVEVKKEEQVDRKFVGFDSPITPDTEVVFEMQWNIELVMKPLKVLNLALCVGIITYAFYRIIRYCM